MKLQKEKQLSVRLNEADYIYLTQKAEQEQLSISALIRRIIKYLKEDEKV